MLSIGSLAFLSPWILVGLMALPILWWLLRAIPPSPKVEVFAGIRLLLGLEDEEREADKTPWWLLLLRILVIAALLIGFSGPVLNPSARLATSNGPVLILMDQGWASAPDWEARKAAAASLMDEAGEAGRDVLFWPLASDQPPVPVSASAARGMLEATGPAPWAPQRNSLYDAVSELEVSEVIWFHDGFSHSEDDEDGLTALKRRAPLTLIGPEEQAHGLTPPRLDEGRMAADVLRAGGVDETRIVYAYARSETGGERRIAVAPADFGPGDAVATATFDLPPELISTVTRLVLATAASAGGAVLADGSLSRLPTGIVAP
ncbi:MAG: BatA domain-containing protein, partial [Pseudomonadota bacterium]